MKVGDPFLLDGNFGIVLSLCGNYCFIVTQSGMHGYVLNEIVKQGKLALAPLEVVIS
jgi:hypothetical protein